MCPRPYYLLKMAEEKNEQGVNVQVLLRCRCDALMAVIPIERFSPPSRHFAGLQQIER